jgi:hypothetical protein
MKRKCKLCKTPYEGRSDKLFCTPSCKAVYHQKLNRVTDIATDSIDKILHRNRSILLEILGKTESSKKLDKLILDQKKFNYTYVTSYHVNSQNKMVNYVYDFSWIIFSDHEVLIKRNNKNYH